MKTRDIEMENIPNYWKKAHTDLSKEYSKLEKEHYALQDRMKVVEEILELVQIMLDGTLENTINLILGKESKNV